MLLLVPRLRVKFGNCPEIVFWNLINFLNPRLGVCVVLAIANLLL